MQLKKNIRKLLIALEALAAAGFLWLLIWGLAHKEPVTGLSGITRVNRPAPDFTLTTFEGQTIALKDLKGKPVVINFWASWCPPCRSEAPHLERVWRAYRNRGVQFLGINIQNQRKEALGFIHEFDLTYPNGPDPAGEIGIDYGVAGIPVTFFVSKKGEIVSRWVGPIDENTLAGTIEEMLTRYKGG